MLCAYVEAKDVTSIKQFVVYIDMYLHLTYHKKKVALLWCAKSILLKIKVIRSKKYYKML